MSDSAPFIIVALCLVAAIGIGWQEVRLQKARAVIVGLEKDLAAAREDVANWQAASNADAASAEALSELALSCLRREADAQLEAAAVDEIMHGAQPRQIAPEEARQGVDDATRKRAATMLNRSW